MAKKYENLEFENCYPLEDVIAFHKLAVKQREPKPQVSQGPNIQTLQIGNNIQNKITHHGNIIDLDITINIGNNHYVVSNSFEFFNSHTHPLESFLFPVSNQNKKSSQKKQPKLKQIQVEESSEAPSLRSSNSPLKKPTKRIRKPGKYYDYENYQYRYYSPKHSQTEENSLQENQNQNQKLKEKQKEKEKKNQKKSLFNPQQSAQKLSKINKQHRKYPPLQRINPNNFRPIEDYENNSTNTSQQESLNQTNQALEEEYDEDEGTLLESQQQNLNSNQNQDDEEEEYEDITNQDTSQCLESANNLPQKPIKLVKKSQSFDPSYQEKNKKTKYYYNKQNISKNNLKKQQYQQQYNQIIKPQQIHPYSETDDSSSVMSKSPLKKTTPIQYSQFYHKSLQNNFNNNSNHNKSEISSQSSLQKNSEISQFNFTSQKQNQSNQSNQLNNFQQNDQSETKKTNTIQDKKQYLQQTQQLNQNHYPYFNNLQNTTNPNNNLNNLNNKINNINNNNHINNINNNNNHIEQEEQTTSEQITNNNNNNSYNNNYNNNNNNNNNSSQIEDNKTSQDFCEESQISSSCEPITSFKLNENKRVDVEELKQAGIFTNRKNAVKNIVKAFNRFLQLKENEQELLNIPQINRDVQVLRDIKKCVNRLERKKKYNQQLIYNIFQSDKLNYTFRHFLVQHAYNWLFESKIKDQDIYEKVIGDYIKWFNQL